MKLVNYRTDLLKRLTNTKYASEYLAEVLTNESPTAFLIALRDVVEARGGNMTAFAKKVGMTRQSLYKVLSQKGNPRLESLAAILDCVGIEMHFRPKLQGTRAA